MKTLEAKIVDSTHLELNRPLRGSPGRRLAVMVADERAAPEPESRAIQGQRLREREDAWCRSHPEALLRYAGQWVVVEGEAVLAHGRDPVGLVGEARQLGVQTPYVFFVEDPQPDVVHLGL